MSVEAITWAFKQNIGKASAKLVLINLSDHANHDRKCWPSLRTIAARTELSADTVIRSIQLLKSKGLITVVHRRDGRVSRSNMYCLNFEPKSVNGTADVPWCSEKHRSTVRPSYANSAPTAPASSDKDSSSTRTTVPALPAPNRHIESLKESNKELPPVVPQRGTPHEFNYVKELVNELLRYKRAWTPQEDQILESFLLARLILADDLALLSWCYSLPHGRDGWVYINGKRAAKCRDSVETLFRDLVSDIDKWRSVHRNWAIP